MGFSPRIFLPERKENREKSRDFRDLQAGPDRHKKLKNGTPARACGEKKKARRKCMKKKLIAALCTLAVSVGLLSGCSQGAERRGHRRGPYTLAFPGQTDTGGSDPAQGEPLYPDFLQTGKLGKSSWYIARKHMLPHLVPQFIVGLVLMFPHAILHESSITFLGFGLSTEQPAIGIVLSEAMQYLITGKCWIPEVSISKEARRRKVWKKRQS